MRIADPHQHNADPQHCCNLVSDTLQSPPLPHLTLPVLGERHGDCLLPHVKEGPDDVPLLQPGPVLRELLVVRLLSFGARVAPRQRV